MKNLEITLLLVLAISSIGVVSVYGLSSPITTTVFLSNTTVITTGIAIESGGHLIITPTGNLTSNALTLDAGTELTVNSTGILQVNGVIVNDVGGLVIVDGNLTINGIYINDGVTQVRCGIFNSVSAPIFTNDPVFVECTEEGFTNQIPITNFTVEDDLFVQGNKILNITGTLVVSGTIDNRGQIANYGLIEFGNGVNSIKSLSDFSTLGDNAFITNYCENIVGRGLNQTGGNVVGSGIINGTTCAIPVVSLVGVTPDIEVVSGTYTELGATCFSDDEGQIDGKVVIGGDTVDINTIAIYDVDYDCEDSNVNPVPASTVTRMVAVVDTTMPLLVLNGESVVVLEAGVDTYTELDGMCFDLLDGEIDVVISGDTVDTSTVSTYVVDYDCQDANSNSASTLQRTVSVADTIPPVITVSKEQSIMILEGTVFDKFEFVTCFDSFDGDLTNSMITVGTVNTLSRTVQEVIYLCQDGELNNDDVTVSYAINKISTSSLGSSVTTTPFGQKVIPKLSDIPTLSVTDSTQQEPQTISDLFANLFSNRININTDDRIDFAEIVNDRVQGIRDTSLGETSDIIQKTTSPIVDFFRNLFAEFFN